MSSLATTRRERQARSLKLLSSSRLVLMILTLDRNNGIQTRHDRYPCARNHFEVPSRGCPIEATYRSQTGDDIIVDWSLCLDPFAFGSMARNSAPSSSGVDPAPPTSRIFSGSLRPSGSAGRYKTLARVLAVGGPASD